MLTWTFEHNKGNASWISQLDEKRNCFSIFEDIDELGNGYFSVALWDYNEWGYRYGAWHIPTLEYAKIIAGAAAQQISITDSWPIEKVKKKE